MTDAKSPPQLAALAAEVCDMWQQHLNALAADPAAKAEAMKMMEPSRLMFAEWFKMAQSGGHGTGPIADGSGTAPRHSGDASMATSNGAHGAETVRAASDDHALRVAQLAHRVAELEKRLARLEGKPRRKAAGSSARE